MRATAAAGFLSAYRRIRCGPAGLSPDEAAAAGLDVRAAADELAGRYRGRGLWRAALWTSRRKVLAYLAVSGPLLLVTPVLPWSLDRLVAAFHRGDQGSAVRFAVVLTVAAAGEALLRWVSVWRLRHLILYLELLTQRLVFHGLQSVDAAAGPDGGGGEDRPAATYLVTYPQFLSQLALVAELAVNGVLAVVLLVCLVLWTSVLALAVVAVAALVLAALHVAVTAEARVDFTYVGQDRERARLVELLACSWQSLRRQFLEGQFLLAVHKVRLGQLVTMRERARATVVSRTLQNGLGPLVSLTTVGVLLLGGGGLDGGTALSALLIVRMLVAVGTESATTYGSLHDAARAAHAIDALFAPVPGRPDPSQAPAAPGTVLLRPDEGPSLTVRPGERIMVVGLPGGGKTTLLEDIASAAEGGTRPPMRFAVACGGTAVLAARGQPLFDGSFAESVTLWRPVEPEAYLRALRMSGLLPLLADRPGRDATRLSTTETRLSEGQVARLSLAQALCCEPDVLLLDDIFAPLDPESARSVASAVLAPGDRTTLFVSTRLELAAYADRFLLVRRGRLALVNRDELLTSLDEAEDVLGAELLARLRDAAAGAAARHAPSADEPAPVPDMAQTTQDDSFEEAPSTPPRPADLLRNGLALFGVRGGFCLLVATAVAVAADLVFAALIEPGGASHTFGVLCAVTATGVAAAALAQAAVSFPPLRPAGRLHDAFARALLAAPPHQRRTAVIGRLSRDFFVLESQVPGLYLQVVTCVVQFCAAAVIVLAGAPRAAPVLLLLTVWLLVLLLRTRRPRIAGSDLAAAVRAPVLAFGAAATGCAGHRLSTPVRTALSRRFDVLADRRAAALHRWQMLHMRMLISADAAGLCVLLTALWGAVAYRGGLVDSGLLVFVAFTCSRQTAGLVESLRQADSLLSQFARLAALLGRTGALPRWRRLRAEVPDTPRSLYRTMLSGTGETAAASGLVADGVAIRVGDRPDLITGFSLTAGAGDAVAIRGPSGAGKSTLLETLSGYREPSAGRVMIAGRPPDGMSARTRDLVQYLAGDVPRLPLGLAEFVAPWHPGDPCLHAHVRRVFDAACVAPPAPSTRLGDLGHGHRQLVNLARALWCRPAVLFLDEATSALDTASERHLLGSLHALAPAAAWIMVLHRPDNLDRVPRVLTLPGPRSAGGAPGRPCLAFQGGA
ncbi:ATP-binding cassette domain-containing protein [Actinomadura rugatobispora]|uniref:ATP-binding cassette domain-containing protein n=1 Tax=Actinomadura rugatobispora TaxID=1994 RepID=A0ABW0ZU78_9ACTN|nr:hypothetical protein GCM10010200_023200 [Actinomadura rugatobispora]